MGYGSGVTLNFSEAEIDRPYALFQNYADFILTLQDTKAQKTIPLHTCYTRSGERGWRAPAIRVTRHASQTTDTKLKADQARAVKDLGAKIPFYIVVALTLRSAMDQRTSPGDRRQDYGDDSYAGILEITGVSDADRLCMDAMGEMEAVESMAKARGWTKLRFQNLNVSGVRCVHDSMIFAGYSRPAKLVGNIDLSGDDAVVEGRVTVSYTYTDSDGRKREGEASLGDFIFDALFIPTQSTRNAYAALDEPGEDELDEDEDYTPPRRAKSAASGKAQRPARTASRAVSPTQPGAHFIAAAENACIATLDHHFSDYAHDAEAKAAWKKVREDLTKPKHGLPADWASRRYATVELGPDDVPVAQSYHGGKLTDLYPDLLLPGKDGEFAVQTIDADLLALKPGEHTFTGGGAAGRWFVMREPDQYDEKTRAYATREPPIGVVIPGNATYPDEYPTRVVLSQWFMDNYKSNERAKVLAKFRPTFVPDDSHRARHALSLTTPNVLDWKAVVTALRPEPLNRIRVPATDWPDSPTRAASRAQAPKESEATYWDRIARGVDLLSEAAKKKPSTQQRHKTGTKAKSGVFDDFGNEDDLDGLDEDAYLEGGIDEADYSEGVHIEQARIRVNRGMKGVAQVDGWIAAQDGKKIAQSESYKGLFKAIKEHMDKQGFFPGIYQTNDHGNVTQYDYKGRVIRDWV